MLDRLAQVARGELLDVQAELDGDRLVEAVAVDEVVADGVGRPLAEDGPARVPWDHAREREHEEDDPEQDRDRDDEPASEETSHAVSVPSAGSTVRRVEDKRAGAPGGRPRFRVCQPDRRSISWRAG